MKRRGSRKLTWSEDVNECAIVGERGHVVVDVHSTDSDGTGSATRRDELGVLGKVTSFNCCQISMHGLRG